MEANTSHDPKFSPWRAAVTIVLVAFVGTLALVGGGGWLINEFTPELKLPLLILLAIVALLGSICLVVVAFAIFHLVDKQHALGLPDGSVRAIIALMLIVLFAAMTVFLIVRLESTPATNPGVDATKQVLTILGTLVTAIASFYFGTQSATAAVTATGGTTGTGSGGTGTGGTGTAGTGTGSAGTTGTGTTGTGTTGAGTAGVGTTGAGTTGAGTTGAGTTSTGTGAGTTDTVSSSIEVTDTESIEDEMLSTNNAGIGIISTETAKQQLTVQLPQVAGAG